MPHSRPPNFHSLEPRALLSFSPLTYATTPAGLPILNSLPGAPTAIYLDFDGDTPSNTTPYSEDADAATFNPTEQANIAQAWRHLAAYFAMFDTNVTTVYDPATPKVWDVIGNNAGGATGGYAYVNTFPNTSGPNAFNASSNARTRQSAMAHEAGHVLGLNHQSAYDTLGVKTAEYISAPDTLHGPLMGVDYSGTVHKWIVGHATSSPATLQDDIAVIAAKVKFREPAGGDGFRADDYANTIAAAAPLTDDGAGLQFASGIIERTSDVDAFSFISTGNRFTLAAIPDAPSGVDLKLELYDPAGNLLLARDSSTNDQQVTLTLPAGTYTALLSSHGDYGDLGQYDFSAKDLGPDTATPPTYNAKPAPTDLAATLAPAGPGVALTWSAVPGATGYALERSNDGVTYAQVATTTSALTYADANPGVARRYFYRVAAKDSAGLSVPSGVASIVNRPPPPAVTCTNWLTTTIVLNWKDVAGDTGYRVERSTDGVNFTPLGTVATNVPSYTDAGLPAGTTYKYRVITLSPQGDSAASAVATGASRLPAVTGAALDSVASNSITFHWADLAGETGYRVERSADGATWSTLANVGANVTTYTDGTVAPVKEYYYRLFGTAGASLSLVPTSTVFTATPDDNTLPPPWSATNIGTTPGGGSSGFNANTFTLVSGGSDINGAADNFRYTSQPIVGDGQIIAKINTLEATDANAKVGVMIRASTAANAQHVAVLLTSGSGTLLQSRATTGGSTASTTGSTTPKAPYWLKLVRLGNTFTAYTSPDGVTWTQIGAPLTIAMPKSALIGLAATSHTTAALNTSTVTNVTVTSSTLFPAVTARAFDFHKAISLTFNKDVAASLTPDDLVVRPKSAVGPPITPTAVAWDAATRTATFTFAADFPAGDYTATLAAAGVYDADNVHPTADAAYDFHALPGDINDDRAVDFNDLVTLAQNYNTTSNATHAQGDLNADGAVDFDDLQILAQNYNTALPTQSPARSLFSVTPIAPRPASKPLKTSLPKFRF